MQMEQISVCGGMIVTTKATIGVFFPQKTDTSL